MFPNPLSLPLESISEDFFIQKKVSLSVLRLDEIHPQISGNKWFKLKYNLLQAQKEGYNTLLTFGGAFSNHLAATAFAGKEYGFKTIGIVRGEQVQNSTIDFLKACGMQLHFVDRDQYKDKSNASFLENLKAEYGSFYLIPEGGTNELAIKGTQEIAHFIPADTDFVAVPIGTGGTVAGLIKSQSKFKTLGFSSLKGDFVHLMVADLVGEQNQNYELFDKFHFGGYAKTTEELIAFINDFKQKHAIQLEPIYTGKLMFGVYELIKADYFPDNAKIVVVHTGGLQGLDGMRKKNPLLR